MMKPILRAFFAAALALLWAATLHAASVRPVTFETLVDDAAIAFEGRCIESRAEVDAATGMVVTLTTFEVQDALKGSAGNRHVIKQIGGRVGNTVHKVDGIPTFEPGMTYVVFLYGVSSAGFSSPVGLGQGKFDVRPGASGPEVTNGRDFREMMASVPGTDLPATVRDKLQKTTAPVERLQLDVFKSLVRQRVSR